jgi:hypothetical protein
VMNPEGNTFRWTSLPVEEETGVRRLATRNFSDDEGSSLGIAFPSYMNMTKRSPKPSINALELSPSSSSRAEESEYTSGSSKSSLDIDDSESNLSDDEISENGIAFPSYMMTTNRPPSAHLLELSPRSATTSSNECTSSTTASSSLDYYGSESNLSDDDMLSPRIAMPSCLQMASKPVLSCRSSGPSSTKSSASSSGYKSSASSVDLEGNGSNRKIKGKKKKSKPKKTKGTKENGVDETDTVDPQSHVLKKKKKKTTKKKRSAPEDASMFSTSTNSPAEFTLPLGYQSSTSRKLSEILLHDFPLPLTLPETRAKSGKPISETSDISERTKEFKAKSLSRKKLERYPSQGCFQQQPMVGPYGHSSEKSQRLRKKESLVLAHIPDLPLTDYPPSPNHYTTSCKTSAQVSKVDGLTNQMDKQNDSTRSNGRENDSQVDRMNRDARERRKSKKIARATVDPRESKGVRKPDISTEPLEARKKRRQARHLPGVHSQENEVEVDRQSAQHEKKRRDPSRPPSDDSLKFARSATSFSAPNLAIGDKMADEAIGDLEAQIDERLEEFHKQLIRHEVPEVTDDVISKGDFPARKRWRWIALIASVIAAGVTLGVVFTRVPDPDLATAPTQPRMEPGCTLCPDESAWVAFPDKELPRLGRLDATCGSLASNPLLVAELLARSSGECDSDVRVYARYCGCSSTLPEESRNPECSFCPHGFEPRKDLVTPLFNDTCSELANFASSLSAEQCSSKVVSDVKASAAYCNCPTSQPSCSLCPVVGDKPNWPLLKAPLFDMTCGELSEYASILSADECNEFHGSLTESASVCGCPPRACSLCRPGESIFERPSRISVYKNYSCAALDGIIGAFSADECSANAGLITENAEHCGCQPVQVAEPPAILVNFTSPSPSPESSMSPSLSCSLCPGGKSPPDPDLLAPLGVGTCGQLSGVISSFSAVECVQQQEALAGLALACECSMDLNVWY